MIPPQRLAGAPLGRRRLLAALLGLPELARATAPAVSALSPFTLHFTARYRGMSAGDVQFALRREGEHWRFTSRSRARGLAKWLAGERLKLDEYSRFALVDGAIQPLEYRRERPGDKPGRRLLAIDFGAVRIRLQRDGQPERQLPARPGALDELSALLAIGRRLQALAAGPPSIELLLVKRNGYRRVRFEPRELRTLQSAIGPLPALRVDMPDPRRSTSWWLSPRYDFLPVHIVHREGGDEGVTLQLRAFSRD